MRNVIPIFDPHRARKAELRQWFTDQAHELAGHVAGVSIAITGDGMVNTSGRGIEPEHAAVILEELKGVAARLEAIVAGNPPATTAKRHQCQVITLRRSG